MNVNEHNLLSTDIKWHLFQENYLLEKDAVHVLCAEVDSLFTTIESSYGTILSIEEQQRADRFQLIADRKRSVCGRYLLRFILGKVLSTAPSDIKFHYSNYRKPGVNGIEFNLSHSGNHILLALNSARVGIDVEQINRNFNYESVLSTGFNEEEQEYVRHHSDPALAFYTLWSRKESIMKASGEGLSDYMEQIRSVKETVEWKGSFYQVKSFQIGTDYTAALATSNHTAQISFWKI